MTEYPSIFAVLRHSISLMVAGLFVITAALKLLQVPIQVEQFDVWGYPHWMMYLIGGLELVTATLLILPKTRLTGAAAGLSVLIGAFCTHLNHSQWSELLGTVMTASVLIGILWLEWDTDS